MQRLLLWLALLLPMAVSAQATDNKDVQPTSDFVKGADVGFLLGQERRGVVFHDREGRERECLELLKTDVENR